MERVRASPRPPLARWAWLVGAGVVALQLACAGRYGIFRDELYYLMCARHLAWGYVDQPPLSIALLAGWKALFGEGVFALRVVPALANGWVALGTALLVREMRGGTAAQTLAAVAAGLMPATLAVSGFYSMNALDIGFWVAAALVVCRLLDDGDRRWWWALGLVFGLGVLNKYSLVFLGVGLGVGILLSPLRRELLHRPCLSMAPIAALLVAPHLAWQISHGWPTREFMHNVLTQKNAALGAAGFWHEQLLMAHPFYLPLWVLGLVGLLFLRRLRRWRPLGVAFMVVGVWLSTRNSKPYYLAPAYPMLLAAGSVLVFAWTNARPRLRRSLAVGLPALAAAGGLAIAPLAIPLLAPQQFVAYEQALGLRPRAMEHNELGELPQHFADRFGWRELAVAVAGVHAALPDADQARCLVVTGNYGECGALNYYGPELGLPGAVSGHNSCWTWWPQDGNWSVVLAVGGSRERLQRMFASVEAGAVSHAALAMPYERDLTVWICREPRVDLAILRRQARKYI
jgi:hypothetical protein